MRMVNRSLDESFELVIASANPTDRPMLRALPRRIGISSQPVGGWDDYSKLEPMKNLPSFARELCADASDATIDRYVLAHRAAGFVGLTIDRVADHQTSNDPALARAVRILVSCWVDRLVEATGESREGVADSIRSVLLMYARGLRDERRYARVGLPNARAYAECVASKTEWLSLATRWMLATQAQSDAAERFQICFESLLLGLQLADDALDAEEDRALRGLSVPDQLEIESASMLIAAEHVLRGTTVEAEESGLVALAAFCGAYADEMRAASSGDQPVAALGAVFLLADMVPEPPANPRATERAIVRRCESGAFERTASPTSSAPSWQPVS